jgi:hypothetical protein
MVGNGRLMYPLSINFGATGSLPNNPNFSASVNYNSLNPAHFWAPSDTRRVYTRWFRFTGDSKSNMVISITSSSSLSFVKVGNTLGVSTAYLECKLPLASGNVGITSSTPNTTNSSTQVTGWMDCSQVAITGKHGNTDGCWEQTVPHSSTSTNITRTITFGQSGGTEKSGGYVLLRITLPQNSTINITSIQLS